MSYYTKDTLYFPADAKANSKFQGEVFMLLLKVEISNNVILDAKWNSENAQLFGQMPDIFCAFLVGQKLQESLQIELINISYLQQIKKENPGFYDFLLEILDLAIVNFKEKKVWKVFLLIKYFDKWI